MSIWDELIDLAEKIATTSTPQAMRLAWDRSASVLAVAGALIGGRENGGGDEHYSVMTAIADATDGALRAQNRGVLDRIDARLRAEAVGDDPIDFATDAAIDYMTPEIDAAYYLGLAIGLRIGGGRA